MTAFWLKARKFKHVLTTAYIFKQTWLWKLIIKCLETESHCGKIQYLFNKSHYSIGQGILLSVQRVYKVFIFSLELQRESQILYFLAGAPARIINPLFSRWSSRLNKHWWAHKWDEKEMSLPGIEPGTSHMWDSHATTKPRSPSKNIVSKLPNWIKYILSKVI